MDAVMANDLRIVRAYLEVCWDKKTGYPCKENPANVKSRGQCYVTALLINKLFGGKIWIGKMPMNEKFETHFWNEIDGVEDFIDLTSDQYGFNGITLPVMTPYKCKVYTKPNFKNKRYLLLVERYQNFGGMYSQKL